MVRRLRRMGEEIGEDAMDGFDALWSQLEREFGALAPAAAPVPETGA